MVAVGEAAASESDRTGRSQSVGMVQLNRAGIDRGASRIGIAAAECECAGAGLDQGTGAGDFAAHGDISSGRVDSASGGSTQVDIQIDRLGVCGVVGDIALHGHGGAAAGSGGPGIRGECVGSGRGVEGDARQRGQIAARDVVRDRASRTGEEDIFIGLRRTGREPGGVGHIAVIPISRGSVPEIIRSGKGVGEGDIAAAAGKGPDAGSVCGGHAKVGEVHREIRRIESRQAASAHDIPGIVQGTIPVIGVAINIHREGIRCGVIECERPCGAHLVVVRASARAEPAVQECPVVATASVDRDRSRIEFRRPGRGACRDHSA